MMCSKKILIVITLALFSHRLYSQQLVSWDSLLQLYTKNAYHQVISEIETKAGSPTFSNTERFRYEILVGNCFAQIGLQEEAVEYYQGVVNKAKDDLALKAIASINLSNLDFALRNSNDPTELISTLYFKAYDIEESEYLIQGLADLEQACIRASGDLQGYAALLLSHEIQVTPTGRSRGYLNSLSAMELPGEWTYFILLNQGIQLARDARISPGSWRASGALNPAEKKLKQALRVAETTFGKDSWQTALTHINLGALYDLAHRIFWEEAKSATYRTDFDPGQKKDLMLQADQHALQALTSYQKAMVASLKSFNDTLFYRTPVVYSLNSKTIQKDAASFREFRMAFLLKTNLYNLMTDHNYPDSWNWDFNIKHYRIRSTGLMSMDDGFDYTLSGYAYKSFTYYDKFIEVYSESLQNPKDRLQLVQLTYRDRVSAVDAAITYQHNTSGSVNKGISGSGFRSKNRATISVSNSVKRSPVLDAFTYAERTKALLLLKEITRLKGGTEETQNTLPTVPHINELQKELDANTAVVSYLISPYNFYIFVITQNNLEVRYRGKLNSNEINRKIKLLRNGILYRANKPYASSAAALGDILIPKLDKDITKLIIIPDGLLNTLPFEVLLENKIKDDMLENTSEYPYLIKKYDISYAFSASLLLNNIKSERKGELNGFLGYAPVFADADQPNKVTGVNRSALQSFDALDSTQTRAILNGRYITPIPNTESEVKYLNDLFLENKMNVRTVTRKQATEAALKQEDFTKYSVLHLATHGFVNASDPNLSGVLFMDDSLSQEDGILYGSEILKLKMNIDLVTLSACETGLGQIVEGEGVLGLSRAFAISGAHNLLVSYWKVSDSSTSDLMKSFYTNAIVNHQDFSGSLRKAKLELIQSGKYSDPFFWSAFILIKS